MLSAPRFPVDTHFPPFLLGSNLHLSIPISKLTPGVQLEGFQEYHFSHQTESVVPVVSLPEFMGFILFGKTILVVNKKFGLFLANQLRKQGFLLAIPLWREMMVPFLAAQGLGMNRFVIRKETK